MSKLPRVTDKEKRVTALVEELIKYYDKRLAASGLGLDEFRAEMALDMEVAVNTLKGWVSRGTRPTGLYIVALDHYLARVAR